MAKGARSPVISVPLEVDGDEIDAEVVVVDDDDEEEEDQAK